MATGTMMAFVLAIAVVGERPPAHAFVGLLLVLVGVLAVVRAELSGTRSRLAEEHLAAGLPEAQPPLTKVP